MSDRDLEAWFAAQRVDDARRTPGFERVVRARRPRTARRLGTWTVAAGIASVVVLLALSLRGGRDAPFELEPGVLRTPTDFLLDLAGPELTRGVPSLTIPDWYPLGPGDPADSNERSHRS